MKRFAFGLFLLMFLAGCSSSNESDLIQSSETLSPEDVEQEQLLLDQEDPIGVNDSEFEELTLMQDSLIEAGNLSGCDQLNNQNFQVGCRNAIVLNQALSARDIALCSELESQADQLMCEFNVQSSLDSN